MQSLRPTEWTAEVLWLGMVTNDDREALLSEVLEEVELTFAGLTGSFHGGLTRASCSRVKQQYPRGTTIRNERQLSLVSAEDLSDIASKLGVESIDPARMGANMVVKGLPDFSHVPPSSRLQAPSGATLVVDMENLPCQYPAKSLRHVVGEAAKGFKPAAEGRRGVTAWVACEGRIAVGDVLRLHIPAQPAWQPGGR